MTSDCWTGIAHCMSFFAIALKERAFGQHYEDGCSSFLFEVTVDAVGYIRLTDRSSLKRLISRSDSKLQNADSPLFHLPPVR